MDFCKNCNNSMDIKKDMFSCNNCGYLTPIKPGTLVFSKNFESESTNIFLEDFSTMCTDATLPRTKDYICPNKSCPTNDKKVDLVAKEATFKRLGKTYKIVYMCCICK